ncbi:MAG TPA: tail fiber domain-containing protein, partial [candidate division Zixibacteria bacterium]|nr:tail fiber domain-containing protein [candidate division Zixibacteria bacterium]
MESLDLIGAPPMGAIAIPNLLEARKGANETTGDTASTWNFVDVDSGCGETATLLSSGGSTRFSRIVKAPSGSISPGGPSTVFSLGMETQTTSAGGGHAQEVLDIVAGYTKTAGLTKTDLITSAETGTSQTREHILLSRQVGVPGATAEKSIAFQTDNSGATATLQRGNATDSTGIEMFAADDSTRLVLYTRTGAARYSNITLKRGVVGAELSLGYDFASPSGMLYAVSSPAAGAQLGINTNTPSTAFHLVGNGCYTGTFGACSDARYKENVETLSHSLNLVRRLRGVRFDWKRSDYPENDFPAGEQVGLIAQEVEAVVPAVVNTGA